MGNEVYSNMIKNNQFELLSVNVDPRELIKYQWNNKYLIEYLLEKHIHSYKMDNMMVYDREMISYYLKYDVIEPLLDCHLTPLLMMDTDNRLLIDKLLEKLSHKDRIKLYHNLKSNSYWSFHDNENYLIEIYQKYNIELPKIFIRRNEIINKNINNSKKYKLLIEEFKLAYSDHNSHILDIVISELYNNLGVNYNRAVMEINELIDYKKNNPRFKFVISNTSEGSFDSEHQVMKISPFRKGVFNHELSHLLFDKNEKINNINFIEEYEDLCSIIDNEETVNRITNYLKEFHQNYYGMKDLFLELYQKEILKKYPTYLDYIKAVSKDILDNNPEIINVDYEEKTGYFITKDNIDEIVSELLFVERQEYVKNALNNYFSEELMVENILDAILHGKILDDLLDIECLSGHSFFQFSLDYTLSFNECLANYDAIKKTKKADKLINDLKDIVGEELIILLDNYLERNRGSKYGK